MADVYRQDNFAGRVDYAARIISSGRPGGRRFATCFEGADKEAVAAALVRRSARNPGGALARNLGRYLCREATAAAVLLAGLDLAQEAKRRLATAAQDADA